MTDLPRSEDIRDLLGLRTRGAGVIVTAFLIAIWVVAAFAVPTASNAWPALIAVALLSVAAVAVVQSAGDPLPTSTTVLLTTSGPVACALALSVAPKLSDTQSLSTWIHGPAIAVFCFMNVRRRRIAPWIGFTGIAIVYAIWGLATDQNPAAIGAIVAIDIAPLATVALFAGRLRPVARATFELRARTIADAAVLSAQSAAAEERTHQVQHLNELARPLLERIASGDDLTGGERLESELLEAHLRDRLRAPLMSSLNLDGPAYRARVRGVDVVSIGDTDASPGEDDWSHDSDAHIDDRVADAVRALATTTLDNASDGQVVVRVSAPTRAIAASVLHRLADGSGVRSEIDQTGHIKSFG
ncbi:hypothetical protein [Gordonia rhizosphera]|uniref:hypothetical protein n=1 Tax=Gordonia rhizosphera TaxID=83341 RepID=UPI001FE1FD64|nr:hypothetical protein [Gordonia rhizosphera]